MRSCEGSLGMNCMPVILRPRDVLPRRFFTSAQPTHCKVSAGSDSENFQAHAAFSYDFIAEWQYVRGSPAGLSTPWSRFEPTPWLR